MNSMNECMKNFRGVVNGEISQIHTALPGRILSYDASSNRAQVQPVGKYQVEDGRALDYPVIANVPIQFPCGMGGKAGITFPIRAGDGCLLVFSESNLDDFLSGGESEDNRHFDLTDAVAIPGLYSGTVASASRYSDDVCLVRGGNYLKVGVDGMSGMMNGTGFSFGSGTFKFDGNMVVSGDVEIGGISFSGHVHGGITPGGGTTSTPQ